ncbi:hypothetical protein LINPERPRIM_LOCUS13276 [Linum perenne]
MADSSTDIDGDVGEPSFQVIESKDIQSSALKVELDQLKSKIQDLGLTGKEVGDSEREEDGVRGRGSRSGREGIGGGRVDCDGGEEGSGEAKEDEEKRKGTIG